MRNFFIQYSSGSGVNKNNNDNKNDFNNKNNSNIGKRGGRDHILMYRRKKFEFNLTKWNE